MTWRWEYDPDEAYVIGGAPPAFVAEVEKKADEPVRAASAFYLDGTGYREQDPKGGVAHVPGGFLNYQLNTRRSRAATRFDSSSSRRTPCASPSPGGRACPCRTSRTTWKP